MPRTRSLVVILAGGKGGRLELLTRTRAKPAVPFAGTHRLIDFPLSNAHNAQISDVWVSQQFNPISLSGHLANGRPWDLDRTTGGLLVLQPRQGNDDRGGFQQGTADAIWRYAPLIRDFAPDAIVVVSADAVYRLDYGQVIEEHLEAKADVTMVTTEVDPDDASRYGVVQAGDGRIREYVYKPEEPKGNLVSNEVFAFRPAALLDTLDELADTHGADELQDLGNELLPSLVDGGGAREHRFTGYWRDVGTIPAYWEAHQELLAEEPPIDLDDPDWPILTRGARRRAGARILGGGSVEQSLLAAASTVGGTVQRSVIGRGVLIEAGATVRDSVLLTGAIVRAGATVERAILDDDVEVSVGATVGGPDGEIALVGCQASSPRATRCPRAAGCPSRTTSSGRRAAATRACSRRPRRARSPS
jgi:glucose-1-phosphate adenylyltransferase